MSGAERNDFNKCRKIRKALYDPKGGTILYQDLINPTADNPIAPETAATRYRNTKEWAFENYKRNCAGGNSSIDNFLMRDYHYNHFGAIRTKKIVNNAVKNRPAWSKNPNNHRYSVPVDMIERVDSRKPQDSYNYPMGDVNVHSPTVVKKDGSWKWFKDGRLQKDSSISYDNHSLTQRRKVKNRKWSDVHPFDAAKMNREKIKPARNKYIDHAQSKVPEGSVPNENNKQPQVKKLMEDWGSEYGKNPDIKKTPKGEPYMKTGNTVKDEPPLNRIMPGTKAWDGIPEHILKKRSGGGCAATKQKKVIAREENLNGAYETYPQVDKEMESLFILLKIYLQNLKDLERYQQKKNDTWSFSKVITKDTHKTRYGTVTERTAGKELVQQYGNFIVQLKRI